MTNESLALEWIINSCFSLQICIKSGDNSSVLSFFGLSNAKQVYFYEYGKPITKKLDFKIEDDIYRKVLSYTNDKQLENKEFSKAVSACQENFRSKFDELIRNCKDAGGDPDKNATEKIEKLLEKKIGTLDEKIGNLQQNINDMFNILKTIQSTLK